MKESYSIKKRKDYGKFARVDNDFFKWGKNIALQRELRGLDDKSGMKKVTSMIMANPKLKEIEKDLLSQEVKEDDFYE